MLGNWFIKTKLLSPHGDRANVFIFPTKRKKCPIGVAKKRLQLGAIINLNFEVWIRKCRNNMMAIQKLIKSYGYDKLIRSTSDTFPRVILKWAWRDIVTRHGNFQRGMKNCNGGNWLWNAIVSFPILPPIIKAFIHIIASSQA